MWRISFLILGLMAVPGAADVGGDVQRKLDAAAAVDPVTREAALQRVLLLHEAEGVVGQVLAAGPPRPDLAILVTPEAVAARAALRDAASAGFAPFCEGREPGECLSAEAEALLARAPEVDREAEREGAIGPSEAGRKIAVTLTEVGHFEAASKIVAEIADPFHKYRGIRDVVLLHLERNGQDPAKRLADVVDLISKFRDPAILAELAMEIADWLAMHGDREGAFEILARAEGFAALVGERRKTGKLQAFVAVKYAELGEPDRAKTLLNQIEDSWWRESGHNIVAVILAELGDFGRAEEFAAAIDDAEHEMRDETYGMLVHFLVEAEEFDEARRIADRIAKGSYRLAALAEIAAIQVKDDQARVPVNIGEEHELALRMAEGRAALIKDPEEQSESLLQIARSYIDLAKYDDAERVAAKIGEPRDRVHALKDLGVALARGANGQPVVRADVLRLSGIIMEIDGAETSRGAGLMQVAQALADGGDATGAEAVADGIVEPIRRNEALGEVAIGLAEAGQLVEALRIAERVEDPAWRAVALVAARL